MRKSIIMVLLFIIISCGSKPEVGELGNLNGYWEIEKVIFPDGGERDYQVNSTVDYIEISEKQGFRKKVQPKFDGSYETSNDAEKFQIIEKDGMFIMHYKNFMSEWTETLLSLSDSQFSVQNEDGIVYNYKRFVAINTQE